MLLHAGEGHVELVGKLRDRGVVASSSCSSPGTPRRVACPKARRTKRRDGLCNTEPCSSVFSGSAAGAQAGSARALGGGSPRSVQSGSGGRPPAGGERDGFRGPGLAGWQFLRSAGRIAMADGSVILVEIRRGTLSRVWNGKVEVVCDPRRQWPQRRGARAGRRKQRTSPTTAAAAWLAGPARRRCRAASTAVRTSASGKSEVGRLYDTVAAGNPLLRAQRHRLRRRGRLLLHRPRLDLVRRTRHLSGASTTASPTARRSAMISFGGTGYNGIGLVARRAHRLQRREATPAA